MLALLSGAISSARASAPARGGERLLPLTPLDRELDRDLRLQPRVERSPASARARSRSTTGSERGRVDGSQRVTLTNSDCTEQASWESSSPSSAMSGSSTSAASAKRPARSRTRREREGDLRAAALLREAERLLEVSARARGVVRGLRQAQLDSTSARSPAAGGSARARRRYVAATSPAARRPAPAAASRSTRTAHGSAAAGANRSWCATSSAAAPSAASSRAARACQRARSGAARSPRTAARRIGCRKPSVGPSSRMSAAIAAAAASVAAAMSMPASAAARRSWVPGPSTATARESASASAETRARRRSTLRLTTSGVVPLTCPAAEALGVTFSLASSPTSSRKQERVPACGLVAGARRTRRPRPARARRARAARRRAGSAARA